MYKEKFDPTGWVDVGGLPITGGPDDDEGE